jgi:hypothetical protein
MNLNWGYDFLSPANSQVISVIFCMHESYQPITGLLSEFIILTDFKPLLLVLAVD